MDRLKAAAIHLCISLLVVGTIAATIFLVWYPRGLWHVAGLDHLFVVMLGIDIVAGPLLTLIVYNRAKPELRRDLTVVALLQLSFLGYGLNTAWASRPVFLVGTPNRMTLVYANQIDDAALAAARDPAFRQRSWHGPLLVGAVPPRDRNEREDLMFSAVIAGIDIEQTPRHYVPYAQISALILTRARIVDGLHIGNVGQDATLSNGIAATGRPASRLRAMPLMSARGEGTVLLDAVSGEPLRTIALIMDSNTAHQ